MATTGTYEERDGLPVVRFERTVEHPVSTVWAAVTEPAQLEAWFPTSERRFEFTWGEDRLTFELEPRRWLAGLL